MESVDGLSLEAARERLESLGLKAEWTVSAGAERAAPEADGVLTVSWGGHRHAFATQICRGLRPSTAPLVLARMAAHGSTLLVADSITGQLAQLVREMVLNYVDLAGNAYLCSSHFLVDVQGRRSAAPARAEARALTKTDLRVILTLIARPETAGASARELGELAGVSHGAAHTAITKLTGRGYLSSRGLRRGASLMDEWTHAYLARGGAHKTSQVLYVNSDVDLAPRLDALVRAQLSGEMAAERLGWPIRSVSAIVYAPSFPAVARSLQGRSEGGGFPVEIRTPVLAPSDNDQGLAASLLIRADMLASSDSRQIEIAQEGLERDPNLRSLRQTS